MIVCICNSVTEHQIRAAMDAGANSFETLQFELGVALGCGKCEKMVREMLHAHTQDNRCTTSQLFSTPEPAGHRSR